MDDQKKFYLTKKGLEDLKKEHEILKSLRSAKTKGEAPKIWESEDLNPEYLSFQEDLEFLETRLAELENILDNFSLIKKPLGERLDLVDLGATVTVQVNDAKDEFIIVGTLEANPALGKISDESPVGHALLGSKVGDEIVISSPVKTIYKIKKIRYS
ncbi:MAG: GreA/GreB family elongation factor [bacterium]|nr:GreA/GreB family elongation factor [bacterium]